MYSIGIDNQTNIISLHFSGEFDTEQADQLYELVRQKIENLKPGFKVLTDLSQLKEMDAEVHSRLDGIMDLCNEKGVSKVVRVLTKDTPDIGFNIMSLFHYSDKVHIQTCSSLEEADSYLNKTDL